MDAFGETGGASDMTDLHAEREREKKETRRRDQRVSRRHHFAQPRKQLTALAPAASAERKLPVLNAATAAVT